MWFQAGADLVVVVHLQFICFVVGGVFLAWRWPRIVWAHIPAVVYGALVEFAGFTCPLTLLENDLRRHAGEGGYRRGFIEHYLVRVIYPPGLTREMQIGLGLLVLLAAIIGYWGFVRRHPPGAAWLRGLSANTRPEQRSAMAGGRRHHPLCANRAGSCAVHQPPHIAVPKCQGSSGHCQPRLPCAWSQPEAVTPILG
jgi:hypothetical protein